ncbi:4-oxalomesaconate tautomerase [Noviherbaspirillum denitrificans]|uniref:4-oxalomesaconate tautomerase n=1 Tax=Noviherbaspirillum denitrificans TaxID=1968433 RepID=A0A254TGK0_9BURK|nr:4-oxalomesaconate tautomerase [Noviherbaspirillum denitrificans]OWW20422.1 4-oxalomesaconate tautomerase [Noviherbaspirillum denitrificans]
MQIQIPCVVMRGGTSKGPFFLASDLPADERARDQVLLSIMGSPDRRQIDGLGGGDSLTSKVAIVSPSRRPGIDVEYLFAQVGVDSNVVDTSPNCGNMLAGVAPFAIEKGLVKTASPVTTVRIFNVNTGKVVEAVVSTPGGRITYDGDVQIDGVPGKGAGIVLNFLDAAGAKTGKLLPTGNAIDMIDGVPVSCVDYSTPIVFLAAHAVGKTGHETKQELDKDYALLNRLETIRRQAARKMGMGDVSGKVLPKIVLLAPPAANGTITSRYFVPWNCHAAHAVTGALCVAAACHIPGSVASGISRMNASDPGAVVIEHPSGKIEAKVNMRNSDSQDMPVIESAGIVRTARLLISGVVYVPGAIWDGLETDNERGCEQEVELAC